MVYLVNNAGTSKDIQASGPENLCSMHGAVQDYFPAQAFLLIHKCPGQAP